MAKAYTFTPPLAATTLSLVGVQPGGSLPVGTYYYVVLAINTTGRFDSRDTTIFSPISNEITATTIPGAQSIAISWTAVISAAAYLVFRATSSDGYWTNGRDLTKINRWSDDSKYYPTVNAPTVTLTDDGSVGCYWPRLPGVMPASVTFPGGIHPRNGFGKLVFTGGTAIDPITFQNIYDWMVLNGYGAHNAMDGMKYCSCFYLDLTGSTETHFVAEKVDWFHLGHIHLHNTHASSEFRVGEQEATGMVGGGGTIQQFRAAGHFYNGLQLSSAMAKFYGVRYMGMAGTALDGNSVYPGGELIISSADVMVDQMEIIGSILSVTAYGGMNNLRCYDPVNNYMDSTLFLTVDKLIWDGWIRGYYTTADPLGRPTFYYNTAVFQIYCDTSTITLIEPRFLGGCTESDGSVTIFWRSTPSDGSSYVDVYRFFLPLITDSSGVPQSGKSITITDDGAAAATDREGTQIDTLTTDSLGYLWLLSLTSTAVTTTSLTVNGAGWVANIHRGRYVRVAEGVAKGQTVRVKSNTSDTLYFCSALTDAPTIGDKAGILIELKQYKAIHKTGSGDGMGLAYTDVDWVGPYTVACDVGGVGTWDGVVTLTPDMILEISLQSPAGGMSRSRIIGGV